MCFKSLGGANLETPWSRANSEFIELRELDEKLTSP